MPIIKNAKKALRSSKKKAQVNQLLRAQTRTALKQSKTNPTLESLKNAFSTLDKSVKQNLMHKNKAARLKSALSKLVLKNEDQVSSTKKVTAKTPKKTSGSLTAKKSSSKVKTGSKPASVKTSKKQPQQTKSLPLEQ